MTDPSQDAERPSLSLARLLAALLPIAAVALAVRYTLPSYEKAAQQQMETDILARLLGTSMDGPSTQVPFQDADGDLVCDPPADGERVTPETLRVSFVAGSDEDAERAAWADLVAALGEATGLPTEYTHYKSLDEQLEALATGEAHVVGLNTGAVPLAVRTAGFQPVCALGREGGDYGYTMKLVAVAGGGPEGPAQLAGKRLAFVRPDSNSGFKAALVYLMDKHSLLPERDYSWGFTYGHEKSIEEVLAGGYDAAPVASDILDRQVEAGEVDESKLAVLYESERFPPATFGVPYNLDGAVRQAIEEAMLAFDWAGTSVAAKYGAGGDGAFVRVNYKDDWANIRRIDSAASDVRGAR